MKIDTERYKKPKNIVFFQWTTFKNSELGKMLHVSKRIFSEINLWKNLINVAKSHSLS